jgi:hypothetical protein
MATASIVRAGKGAGLRAAALVSTAPLTRPCSTAVSRSRGNIWPEIDEDEESSVDWPAQRGAQE